MAGRGVKGDAEFTCHIVNARGYVPMTSRDAVDSRNVRRLGRTLPVERGFAMGGIGWVHGYAFKEVSACRVQRPLGKRHQGQCAAFTLVVGTQQDEHIFGGNDEDQRP